ncbi:hypothetical protein GGQ54_002566 [Naumannella cuiyingiana]|uniref:DUF2797 domain-containing protein n=1 Tax=Naumannella cuiyingiana TaxID=1347891 RepID=A0A7Z0ILW9_9ACTN|nr:hypothetical protein [Naumannella cuiyingiana]
MSMVPPPGEWLVHGVRLRERPVLALADAAGKQHEFALPGARLAYRMLDEVRWCLGRRDAAGTDLPCPDRAPAVRGNRCERCEAADPFRWLHIVHRSAFVDPVLREQVMRPHWLYVASFGPGLHKVGTAVDERRWRRVAEQGALVAGYVALVADGLEVRRLEDLVSAETDLGQVVRPSAKAAALAAGATPDQTRAAHTERIGAARELLASRGIEGVVHESWQPDPDPAGLLADRALHPFPGRVDGGTQGFGVDAVIGSAALARLDGDDQHTFVADLTTLKGRRIGPLDAATAPPAVQDGLF